MAVDLTSEILGSLGHKDPLLTAESFPDTPFAVLKASLDRLASREMITYKSIDKEEWLLSKEAEEIVQNGSHEARVFEAVLRAVGGLKISDLPGVVGKDAAKVGPGKALKEGWITKDKASKDLLVPKATSITDTTQQTLQEIQKSKTFSDPKVLADLKKRKLLTSQKVITFSVSKGPKYQATLVKEETDLTYDMLASGAWKDLSFKPYNFAALGARIPTGAFCPLSKVRTEFRQIFFEMGFEEMPTNRFVESGFWNFDALFVPQQHPARDLQDTFYISDPASADPPRADPGEEKQVAAAKRASRRASKVSPQADFETYYKNVQKVHQDGAFGSIGYRYPWKEEESLRLCLRTHTTAVSTYMLHKLAKNPRPARYFSIDRVFRNEAVDMTHLAEFHQVEGVIADFGLTLGGLIGFMETFFAKMGIHQLRFKPAYNPYTEPSMEIFGYHEGLGKWVEIGNSGMFRPEMLLPMGLPKDLRVYGWGLSLERPTMIKYAVKNIRDLLGHKIDLNFIETNPAVRLDKE